MAGIWGEPHSYVGEGIKSYGDLIAAQLNKARAVEQEQKNPYVGQRELEALLKDRLVNKWYGPKMQSDIGLQGAQAGHLNEETKWIAPNARSLNAYRDIETQAKQREYANPGMLSSTAEVKDAAIRDILMKNGGSPAVQLHDQIQQNYPEAPLHETIAAAIQTAQNNGQKQSAQMTKNIADKVSESLMQQPGQQGLGQVPKISALNQSMNEAMQPQKAPMPTQEDILNRSIEAGLSEKEAKAEYYKQGGSSASTLSKNEMTAQKNIMFDNPDFSPEDAKTALNQVMQGKYTMPDGREINVGELTHKSLDVLSGQGIPAQVRANNIMANQASAEMEILKDYTQPAITAMGRTYLNKSPQAIVDSFKSDEESQRRLGRFIAAQQLQYDIAQNQLRINGGKPGVRSTEELMEKGLQNVDLKFPTLSTTARIEAQDYAYQALDKALQARNKIGEHPHKIGHGEKSSSTKEESSRKNKEEKVTKWKMVNGNLVKDE